MKKSIVDSIFELKSGCLSKEGEIQKKLKLSPAEFRGLIALMPGEEMPYTVLSKKMGLTISRGSRVIKKMLEDKFLTETVNKDDKRILKVKLSAKGTKARNNLENMLSDCEQKILHKLTKSEREIFEKSLGKISEILYSY